MIRCNCILCPVDFSDCSKTALQYAAALAKRHNSRLLIQHSLAPLNLSYINFMLPGGPDREFQLQMQAHARETLKSFAKELLGEETPYEELLAIGRPVVEIVEAAQRERVNLLVMGTHGRSGLERFLLGSVTEKLLRKAPCPVLVVRCGAENDVPSERPGLDHFNRILVPVDLSEHSGQTLSHAVDLADSYHSELFIVHVLERPTSPGVDPGYEGMLLDYWGEVRDETARLLSELTENSVRGRVREEHRVVVGQPAEEILRVAREKHVDLVVMGTKPSWVTNFGPLGSTAHRIICHAACPVLLLR